MHLTPTPDGAGTRVHLRVRGRMSPWWFAGFYVAAIIPADFIMATGMLRGLKARVETNPPPVVSGRAPLTPSAPSRRRPDSPSAARVEGPGHQGPSPLQRTAAEP